MKGAGSRPSGRRSTSVPPVTRRFKLAEGDNESVVQGAFSSKRQREQTRIDPRDLSGIDPIHTELRPSLLSIDAAFSRQNFRGFYTLAGLILVAMNTRLVVENLLQYGFLVIPRPDVFQRMWRDRWPCATVTMVFPFLVVAAHLIECLAFHRMIDNVLAVILNIIVISSIVFLPIAVIQMSFADLVPSVLLLGVSTIIAMKIISFAHVRHIYRNRGEVFDPHGPTAHKPSNEHFTPPPRLSHLLWFILAPTLCYQEVYPRSNKIRLGFIVRRLCEIVFILSLQFIMFHQYIMPTINHAVVHVDNRDIVRLIERILKLCIPNTLVWLLGFYILFHSTLNLTAEFLRFGDRLFYMDWWNAPSLGVYWRTWNLPVRHWMLRHIYAPALRAGAPPVLAQFAAFLVSAVVHEVFISVPCHIVQIWTFLAMLSQIPLIILTDKMYKKFKQPVWGNVIFWLVFCIFGQPLLMILYGHAYVKMHLQKENN